MKKLSLIVLVAFLGVLAFTVVTAGAEDGPAIVGVDKCKICHKKDAKGNQYKVWLESKHAGAFATLASEASLALAKEMGIEDPQKDEGCLYCHTTKGFLKAPLDAKTKYTDEEGVGCEACHGAGSEYKSMKVMKDHEASIAAGLLLEGESNCVMCHNEKSPTFKGFEYAARWEEVKHPHPEAE